MQNLRVTDIQQLFNHHSSYTTHHTPLIIIHHSSYTTFHTPLITHHSSYTTHHTPLIIHQSPYTTHHTPLIIHVQISWQAQYKMRCGEIADARNAIFFHGTGGSEAGKSRSAERRLRDGLGSFSRMVGIVPPFGLEFSLVS